MIDGKKVYLWCIAAIVAAAILFMLNILNIKELFFTVAYFGERIFSRHSTAKQERKLEAITNKEFTVSPDKGVHRFI